MMVSVARSLKCRAPLIANFLSERAAQDAFEVEAWRNESRRLYPVTLMRNQNGLPQCTVETIKPAVQASSGEFEHPMLPTIDCLQKNLTATRDFQERTITWSCHDNIVPDSMEGIALEEQGRGRATGDGKYVRGMKIGDVVTVWAKARFPGWVNTVTKVQIDVYWAV